MTNIKDLKDGVYDKVISIDFDRKLKEASEANEIWLDREDVDGQEAVPYLSSYLEKLIRLCLKDIADDNHNKEAVQEELSLANQLIQLLSKRISNLGEGHDVTDEKFILKSLEHQLNKTKERKWELPATSLSRSFLFTNSKKDVSMVHELAREIACADRIDMLVSFIRSSGLNLILPYLRQFTNQGGRLRIVTTTYMGATDPKAIKFLAELPNTEIKISYNVKETRLHAKSYMFYRESGFSTAYVGSSNLSRAAIGDGMEWNMKVTEQDLPNVINKMKATFEVYWHSDEFQDFHLSDMDRLQKAIDKERHRDGSGSSNSYSFDIQPYSYQQAILDALRAERYGKNRWRNLVVAATGTGKTAISAFDFRNFYQSRKEGAKLLFIAHRGEILKQSLSCFRQVMKDPNFGELDVGKYSATRSEHLFMSIQTFNSHRFWENMEPDYYDMIIVDEFHHAAAKGYQKLLSYFHPKILLGLTATPERMDGKNILSYFDGTMSAEIRLPDAIEKRLLCPFHYFGVNDPVNLESIKWTSGHYDVKELENVYTGEGALAKQRAGAIIRALDRYTADLRDVKALGFCVSKAHAHYMANYFNEKGIKAKALDADTPDKERNGARQELERGDITILFVVDLFNEGVDIPAVNTVLFLRPTNSMTVFLQQLGRGLRLFKGKDCLTVLDFVAQSSRKYDFASRFTSLLGDKHVVIKKEIIEKFPHVPNGCSIQLEEIAQKHVLDNINSRLRKNDFYIEMVQNLSAASGSVPKVKEFFKASSIDPYTFYNGKRTYARLLADAELIPSFPITEEEESLQKAMPRLLSIDSPKWISFISKCHKNMPSTFTKLEQTYLRMWQMTLFPDSSKVKCNKVEEAVTRYGNQKELNQEILDVLDYQYNQIDVTPEDANLPYLSPLEVYCNYSRDQIFSALGFEKPSSIREGVKYLDKENSAIVNRPTDVFLVTLNKSEKEFSDTTLYEDYSIDRNTFHWQSQSTITPFSKTGQRYINQRENGGIVLLFVRKSKKDSYGNSMAYTFLGTAHIIHHEGSQPITILYHLDYPIPAKYIVKTDTAGVL